MKALNDPVALKKYVNPEIIQQLTPQPLPEEMNMYMVEMSERNGIPLQEINVIGHKFTKNFNQIPENIPEKKPENFSDMEKQLAEELKKNFNTGFVPGNPQQNVNPYGQSFNPNEGYNPNMNPNQGFNPNTNPY